MYSKDLYDESREKWLRQILREPRDLANLVPLIEEDFLENFNEESHSAHPSPFLALLQDYAKAQPMEKALINLVLRRLANVTVPELVKEACSRPSRN